MTNVLAGVPKQFTIAILFKVRLFCAVVCVLIGSVPENIEAAAVSFL